MPSLIARSSDRLSKNIMIKLSDKIEMTKMIRFASNKCSILILDEKSGVVKSNAGFLQAKIFENHVLDSRR